VVWGEGFSLLTLRASGLRRADADVLASKCHNCFTSKHQDVNRQCFLLTSAAPSLFFHSPGKKRVTPNYYLSVTEVSAPWLKMRAQHPFGAPQGFRQCFFTFRIFCVKLVANPSG